MSGCTEECYAAGMSVKAHTQAKTAAGADAFLKRYNVLNDGQKRAVDTIEGPVMVVAGPGTGKTEVVALRVANILRKTHARPSNILCLTFSVSGATAMRERLRSLMGADAYGVTIRNFHGFCADLIAENPSVFDAWSAMELISDVEKYRTVNKIIDQLSPDLDLINPKLPHARTKDILSRISDLKREGVTNREALLAVADDYERALSCKSREGTKACEKNLLTAKKFRDFLKIFFLYEDALKATQRFDFDDMILYAIQALEAEDWLLAGLQERYQYILVDEFQDTNGAQYRLVDLLTTPRTPEDKPNLFVVGDDDQAIYRFQGANLKNILNFHERFPSAPIIPLTVSYRCSQPVLDAAGSLIAQNSERLVGRIPDLQKNLTAGGRTDGPLPTLLFAPSDSSEPWVIADILQDRLKEGIAPEDIAVFCQTNAEVLRLYEVFTARGIPVSVSGKADLLAQPFVTQAIAILKGATSPSTDAALSAALACECFGCHAADISRMALRAREAKTGMLAVLLALDQEGEGTLAKRGELIAARNVLLDLHEKMQTRTVTETLEALLKDSGLLRLARGGAEGKTFDAVRFSALQEFFDWVKERAFENQAFTAESLLSDLSFYGNPDYPELTLTFNIPHLVEKGIALMTAHQSKGLQFDVVLLSNFREGHWDKRRNPSSLSLPEDLLFGWEKNQKSYERNQDERRLAYVAITRAKREVLFVCPKELTTGDKMRSVSPSGFFAEAGKLPERVQELNDPASAALLLFEPVRAFDAEMRAYLLERLRDYALSVTALNHFLEDPKKFLEVDLLQTPQAKHSSLVYGNAVHDALKKWGLSVLDGQPFSEEAFLAAFRTYMETREILTDKERARLIKAGSDALPLYYRERLSGRPLVHKVEYNVTTRFNDIPLKGKIDRIDLLAPGSADVVVIDYKTGRPKTENEIRTDGDYFRQLVFYALLLEAQGAFFKPKEFVLDFIGEKGEHPVVRPFLVTPEELKDLKEVVQAVWKKITALDFTPL